MRLRLAHSSAMLSLVVTLALLSLALPVLGYVHRTLEFRGGAAVVAHWPSSAFPVWVTVTPGLSTDIAGNSERGALESALATWSGVSDSIADLRLAGEVVVEAGVLDGINAVQFSNDPSLENSGIIALTFLLTDTDGSIQEADMLLNDRRFGFTTSGGSTGLDLETLLLHELGNLLGLDHSPLGALSDDRTMLDEATAVLFPVNRSVGEMARALRHDDIAGLVAMYPQTGSKRGRISGRVTQNGASVFGAHVIAFDPITEVLIGAVTLPDGSFTLDGLPPGRYLLEAAPLSVKGAGPDTLGGVYSDGDVNTSFRAAFLGRTIRIAPGSAESGVHLEVQ